MTTTRYPLKFLDAYTRADRDFFFGREAEIAALYEMVFQTDLLLVYGASGTGKTSLIQCGLANKFEEYDWMPLFVRRGEDINTSLADTLARVEGGAATEEEDLAWLEEDFSSATDTATERVTHPLALQLQRIYLEHFKPIYLIFDQFEELYILGSTAEQEAFVRTVQDILRVEQPVKIILSIREEYLGYLYDFERAVPELLRKKLRVEPMNLAKVKTVLTSLGELDNSAIRLAPGEADALGEEVFARIRGKQKSLSIPLPYLQVFLDKLYRSITQDETRQAVATFNLAALYKLGNIDDVLRDFLDEQVLQIAQDQQVQSEVVWDLLSPFVTLEGTKEPLSAADLQQRSSELPPERVDALLQALVRGRILRYREEAERYEVAHDSLAKQINAKRSDEEVALLEVRRLIRSQVSIKAAAREYFSGKQLDFMAEFLPKLVLHAEEEAWIAASETRRRELADAAAREQEKKLTEARKRARTLGALLVLAVLALVGAGLSYWQAQQAKEDALAQKEIAQEKTNEAEDALVTAEAEKAKAERAQQAAEAARDSVSVLFESLATETTQREAAERNKELAEERAALNQIFDQIDRLPAGEERIGIRQLQRLLEADTYPNSRRRIQRKLRALEAKQ
ncbi:MAG: AAA family ATPase [Bacteroidota bacterium]